MLQPIVHIIGARPNFMKAAPVIDALEALGAKQYIIHTGQHYDERMSKVFFDDLGLPEPHKNLGIGSGSHGDQTGRLLIALETTLQEVEPSAVVVYGDVNSTLAAALVSAKLDLPLVHVEAGLRSFDWGMPEEVNRRVTDLCANLLLVTSPEGIGYLGREGVDIDRVHLVGNPMIDTLIKNLDRLDPGSVAERYGLPDRYIVSTLHRPANVDDPEVAAQLVGALRELGERIPVVIPLHPRGRERLAAAGLVDDERTRVIDPVGYVEFLSMVRGAAMVVTDSGGVQEETTIMEVPCLTVRPNTERPITLTHGTNRLVAPSQLLDAAVAVLEGTVAFPTERPPLWDGHAGDRCAALILRLVDGTA